MRKLRALIAIGVAGAGLAACTDQPTSAPTVHRVAGVNATVGLPTCNFTTLKAAVRDYVAAGNDVIYDYIRDMSTDAYGQGMNGLARLAQVRGSVDPVLKKSGATTDQGAAAVIQFVACMPIGTAVQDGFQTNIVAAFAAGGLFEVPTLSSTDPVFSRGEAEGAQYWAARPSPLPDPNPNDNVPPPLAPWSSLTTTSATPNGVRFMIFGYKTSTGFDYNVVPMLEQATMPPEFANSLVIGACGSFGSAVRVLHVSDVLFDQDMGFCAVQGPTSPPIAWRSTGFGSDLAMLVRRGLTVFAPTSGYAFGGGVGGAVSELSPTDLLTVGPKVEFAPQPANNKVVLEQLGIKVRVFTGATWQSGNPLNNAEVILAVTGNSGKDAILYNTTTGKSCDFAKRTTVNGVADFSNIGVTKAGGYTLTATASWDQLNSSAVVSSLFNIKNKKITTPPVACPA